MTGEQQTPEAESPPAFGEILINPQAETAEKKEDNSVPPAKSSKQRTERKRKPKPKPKPPKPPKTKRKKNKEKKSGSKKKLLLCSLAFILLLPAALFLSYLAAVTYLLPYYIQERLTEQYSQQLNRPVTVTQAQFAPFSFDLHLAGIHIGPERSRKNNNEPALCRIATIDTRLRPEALLDGKVVFENVQIKGMQAEVARRADGSFTDLGLSNKEALGKTTQSLLPSWFPSWLQVDGFSLTESMLVLRDATNGHEYHLDEIAFSLPSAAASAANQQDAKTPSLPTLHALVNGNPVQIRGERHIRPDNSSVTRLRLQLDDVDPQQIVAWLPNMGNSLRITTEKTTASLELILPDSPQPQGKKDKKGEESKGGKEEITLSGKVSFTGLNITSLKTNNFQCKAPSAELVIQANPLRKQYQVEELTLNSPQFSFTESKSTGSPSGLPFSHWPGQLLTPASLPIDLIIHHLTINQGTLHKEHDQPWENLQLELTGYRNRELPRTTRAKALSFSAQQGPHKVQFQGTTTPDLDLIGKISLHNLDARLLNPYLETVGAGQTVQLKDGTAQLVMQINPVQKQYTITELILDKPELFELKNFKAIKAIKSSSPRSLPFSLPLDQLFNPVFLPFDLIIHQLTINQGTLQREQAQPWKNLQLKLTNYRNRELLRATKKHTSNKAKALSFSAQQGARKVQFQGTTTPAFDLIGKISLHNWNARFLNPYLKTVGADQTVQLKDGTAQLVMQVNPLKKQYIITELTLDKPELKELRASKKSSSEQLPLAISLGQILNPASLPFDLIIHQLTIKQGTLQRKEAQPWKNLQFKLTNYRNRVLKTKKATKAKALSFSAQQGAHKIQFQGTTTPTFDLIGKISLHNWNARFLNPYLETVQLKDGTAQLVMQVSPGQKQYIITELTLDTPQIKVNKTASSDQFPFAVPLGELFNPVSLPFHLVIDRLTINKGIIEKKQGPSWQDLQLNLTDYRNGEKVSAKRKKKASALSFTEASALSFTARQGKVTVRFQGKVAPDLSLSGKIALRNLHSSLFQPYLEQKNQGIQRLKFSGEQAELEGLLKTVQPAGEKKKILIKQAKVILPHISMQQGLKQGNQQGQPLLTAGLTTAEGCALNLTKPGISCTDLTLQQADFSPAAPSFFLAQEKTNFLPGFSFDTLKITDSKARLPLRSSEGNKANSLTVPITDLNLELNNLQAAQSQQKNLRNLRLEARVGMYGKMSAQGSLYQGKARLELAVENLNIKLLEKPFAALFQQDSAPTLHHGLLSFQGQLQLPELNFEGNAQLDDFMAQNNQGTLLRWKSGTGSHVLAGMQPFFVHIEELVVQEPKLQLGSPDRRLPGALLTLLRQEENKPVLPPFTIKQCRIQGGSLPSINATRNFTGVDGDLTPLAAGTPAIFTFAGKVNDRKFTAQGRLEQNQAEVDNFTVAELSLENTAKQFIKQLGLQEQGKIRWIPSDEQGNQDDNKGMIHCTNFLPQQKSEYALLLGILTNNKGEFSLPLSLPATASPAQISKAALKKIHRLHLQAVVSPQAMLEKELPDLTLPERINFIVGDSLPDFMGDLESFVDLLSHRPHLRLQLRGCYDDMADREYLLRLLQEEEDYRTNLENIRRQEEMARLLAEEELRQVQLLNTDLPIDKDLTPVIEAQEDLQTLPYQSVKLPKKILPELVRQRARVVQAYLVDTLKLPAEKISLEEVSSGGPWVDLLIKPYWTQPAQVSEPKKKG